MQHGRVQLLFTAVWFAGVGLFPEATAMNQGSHAALDTQGRPVFLADEVQQILQEHVDLYDADEKRFRGGRGVVTTHRLLYLHPQMNLAWALQRVLSVSEKGSLLGFTSPKVCVVLSSDPNAFVQFSFKNGGSSSFAAFLRTALTRRSWQVDPSPKRSRTDHDTPSGSARPFIGVSGLLARMEAVRAEETSASSQALADISALMENVRRVADTAKTVAFKLQRRAAPAASSSSESGGAADGSSGSLQDIARDFGLQNPVTKAHGADSAYLPALAREISLFARPKLKAAGGVVALTDMFCLYNRARGTDLVSPADFAQACGQMAALGVGMHGHSLPSGLRVLQLDSHSAAAMHQRIQEHLSQGTSPVDVAGHAYTTALLTSRQLKVSLTVAQQYLLGLEQVGGVVRDTGLHGTRFYLNTFFC